MGWNDWSDDRYSGGDSWKRDNGHGRGQRGDAWESDGGWRGGGDDWKSGQSWHDRTKDSGQGDSQDDAKKRTIWVGGCPSDVTEADLSEAFSKCGYVKGVNIKHGAKDTFAFVEFAKESEARHAKDTMDQAKLFGNRPVKVNSACRNKDSKSNPTPTRGSPSQWNEEACREYNGNRDTEPVRRSRGNDDDWNNVWNGHSAGKGDRDDGAPRARGRDDGAPRARGCLRSIDRSRGHNSRGGRSPEASFRQASHGPHGARGKSLARSRSRGRHQPTRTPRHTNGHVKRDVDSRNAQPSRPVSKGVSKGVSNRVSKGISKGGPPSPSTSPSPVVKMKRRVRITIENLPPDMDEDEFKEIVDDYGEVTSYDIFKTSNGVVKRGIVEYRIPSAAEEAISELDGRTIEGWEMVLKASYDCR